jgi:hypothetical protein
MGITTAVSDKSFKKLEHRRERTAVRKKLHAMEGDAALPHPKAFGDPWKAPKDGKQWLQSRDDHSRWLRK